MEQYANQGWNFVIAYGPKLLAAVLILVLGRLAAGLVKAGLVKALARTKTDQAVVSFVGALAYIIVIVFVILAALAKVGVQTTSLVAVVGAAGLAVGLALQGSLSNFASGIMLLILKPFRIGDYIEGAGAAGTVKEISLLTTTLATPDNIKIVAPNSKLFGDVIKNVTAYDVRRVDMVIGIGYGSSMDRAMEIMEQLLEEDERVLKDKPIVIAVAELADSSVNFNVRPWVKKEDYWTFKWDFLRRVKSAFDENDIEIPFPQQTVHLVKED